METNSNVSIKGLKKNFFLCPLGIIHKAQASGTCSIVRPVCTVISGEKLQ